MAKKRLIELRNSLEQTCGLIWSKYLSMQSWIPAQIRLERICINPKGSGQDSPE